MTHNRSWPRFSPAPLDWSMSAVTSEAWAQDMELMFGIIEVPPWKTNLRTSLKSDGKPLISSKTTCEVQWFSAGMWRSGFCWEMWCVNKMDECTSWLLFEGLADPASFRSLTLVAACERFELVLRNEENLVSAIEGNAKSLQVSNAKWFPSSGAEIRGQGESFLVGPIHHPVVSRATLEGFVLPAIKFIVWGLENWSLERNLIRE